MHHDKVTAKLGRGGIGVVYKARAARVSKRFPLARYQPVLGKKPGEETGDGKL